MWAAAKKIYPTLTPVEILRSGLRDLGWIESQRTGTSIGANGEPIPWFTYASIFFLDLRVRPEMRVFEYGSGGSTWWWSDRVSEVTSCEHDDEWTAMLTGLPDSVEILLRPLGGGYPESIRGRGPFDIVVVDGRERVESVRECLTELSEEGVVVFDNSDREEYLEGYKMLAGSGFRQLEFRGFGPVNSYIWTTSIFYRPKNCLGI